jgi:type II secretory pathway component PulF
MQGCEGVIEADSPQEAVSRLSQSGYFPVSVKIEENAGKERDGIFSQGISGKEISAFTRQLSGLIYAGVPILRSLDILLKQTPNKSLRSILADLKSKIRDGNQLSASLAAYPDFFPPVFISMVHSGEVSGNLDKSLKRLADHLDQEQELKESVIAAVTYPAFVTGVGIITVIVLLVFVIPTIASMFIEIGEKLPLPTRILMGISGFFQKNMPVVLVTMIAAAAAVKRFSGSASGQLLIDKLKLKLFLYKDLVIKAEIGRLMRTLSLLLASGVPVLQSMDLAASTVRNKVLNEEVKQFRPKIVKGLSFSKCLSESKLFPEYAVSVTAIGEETGTLERSLMAIAEEYENDVERRLRVLTRMLEPVIILIMGIIVGFIVLAMLLPVFNMDILVQ